MAKISTNQPKVHASLSLLQIQYFFIDLGKHKLYGFGQQRQQNPAWKFHSIDSAGL